jgi:hypothetical protein
MVLVTALPRVLLVSGLALVGPSYLAAQAMTRLSPESDRAFDDYIAAAEGKLDWRAHVSLPDTSVRILPAALKPTVEVPGAIIHDWTGAVFVPSATVEQALAVLQSYDDYKRLYSPQVAASKLYGHEGNLWRVYLKLHKKKIFTADLDTEYSVEYRQLEPGRWSMLSHSTKVTEVDGDRSLPVGRGHGYLWRLNAYWVLEQRVGGVYVECRAISMSRDVPAGLGWALNPIVKSVPIESLQETLEATRRALQ